MKRRDLIKLLEITDGGTSGRAATMTSIPTGQIVNQYQGRKRLRRRLQKQ